MAAVLYVYWVVLVMCYYCSVGMAVGTVGLHGSACVM